MLTSNDILSLFEPARSGDPAAMDRLADAAGEALHITWSSEYATGYWHIPDANKINDTDLKQRCLLLDRWNVWGRHAPLLSLDCAMDVKMPGDIIPNWDITNQRVWVSFPKIKMTPFPHDGTPKNIATAWTAAALWAIAKQKELDHAR